MKVTDKSISKVLDWFSRSSNPDAEIPSLPHPKGMQSKGKSGSEWQNNNTMDMENAVLQQDGLKSPVFMQCEMKAVETSYSFWVKGDLLSFENDENSGIEFKKSDGGVLPTQAGKEKGQLSSPFRNQNQGSKSIIPIQDTKNPNEEIETHFLNTDYPFNFSKELDAECQASSKVEDSSYKEKLKFFVNGKNRGNSKMAIDSSENSGEPQLKHNMEAKGRRVKKADCLSFPSEGENIRSPTLTADEEFREKESNFPSHGRLSAPCKKPEDLQQQEASHLPGSQVQREEYKRVSDRISFWEGGGKTVKAKLTDRVPNSARNQVQVPATVSWPVKSVDLSVKNLTEDQNEFSQVIAKRVDLIKNGQISYGPGFYSSVNSEGFNPHIMGTSRGYPSVDQPGKIPSFQSESVKLPMTDNLQSKRGMTFSTSKHDSHERNEAYSHLENDRSSIAQPNPNFKVWTLEERMNENFPKQINNLSQFQNLRNFWDMGTNSLSTNNSTHPGSKKSLSLDSQKEKELDETELTKEKSASAGQGLLKQDKASYGEEIREQDSKLTPRTLSDESTFPLKSPAKSTQLPKNVPSKENVDEHLDWLVPPMFREEGHFLREEVKESVMKTSVLPKEYQDTFNRSLKKLLEGAPSLSFQPVGDKDTPENGHEPNLPKNRVCLQETDLADFEKRSESIKQVPKTSTASTLYSPEATCKPFVPRPEKSLKEASELPYSSSQVRSATISTGTSSLSKQTRFFEKVMERSYNYLFHEREGGILLKDVGDASDNTVAPLKIKSSDCKISQKGLPQKAPAPSHSLYQTAHLKDSFGEAANSPQEMSSFHSAYAALCNKGKPLQREISETMEKTVLPKMELDDLNTALENLHKEAQEDVLNSTRDRRTVLGEQQPGIPEGGTGTQNQINSPVWLAGEPVVPEEKSSQPLDMGLEEPREEALGIFPVHCCDPPHLDQSLSLPGSTSYQHSKESPQEISETLTKTIIQPKATLREFDIGLEKLLREASESPPLKLGNDKMKTSEAKLIGGSAFPGQTADQEIQSPDFLEKIRETIEKSLAPSVVESAFDLGFEKILKEAPVTEEKGTLSIESSPSEQGKLSRKTPHLYSWNPGDAKVKVKSKVLKPKGWKFIEDKAEANGEGGPQDSESRMCNPGTVPAKNELKENVFDGEPGDSACGATGEQVFLVTNEDPSEKQHWATCRFPSEPLSREKTFSKISKVELLPETPYKRGEERGSSSGSDFSDEYVSSNTDSWRSSSRSEESNPVLKALKRNAARKMPSQSLEDIPSDTSNQGKVDFLPEDLVRSAEDVSTVPSHPDNQFAHPEKLKRMSKSVPAFLQDESDDRETDTTSESSYQLGRHKKSPSSLTNLFSSSSGMTSLSSVSGSAMSVYSGDFGNLDIKGSVQFAIDYVDSLMEFHVFVAQCKDLAAADVKKQRSDPYVKTYLLPDKGKMGKKKTLVMKKTLNPVYNEILRYKIDKQSLKNQKLNLSVWHRDTFKRNSFLGEVELDLETWDWDNKQNKQLKWYPLNRRTAPIAIEAENRGEMKLALQYVPEPFLGKKLATTGEVHIWVKECIDLPHLRGNHLNSFVKCTILPDTSRKSRQKTRAVGKTTNPLFNHTMVYDGFRPGDLKEACVELTVWDHHKLTNQFLGGLRIGFGRGKSYGTEVDWMDSTPAEISLWERMVNSPNTWVEDILPLRMLLIAKLTK
ncbi:synaptotagmin-like protein 2 isoform X2 [Phascolarctos cinereus]|uniref:Synaptotagmin-like protein 2 n=1 Tax=Phascolarctos cinereus TaxID=38626 RepID=A0A6P5KVU7_PHACI|nr:synaptotagmin-like protein 2 isoform X2 [Phascolarctos cinereus]